MSKERAPDENARGIGAIGFDFVELGLAQRGLSDSIRAFGARLPTAAQFEREDFLTRWIERKSYADELFERLYTEIMKIVED